MIDISNFLQNHQNNIISIISNLKEEFSSHDFIEKFSQMFESDYIEMLVKYQHTGSAFQTVHSKIARYLSTNKTTFKIIKISRSGSENVFGSIDYIQWWKKV